MIDIWRTKYRWVQTIKNGRVYYQQEEVPASPSTLDTRYMMFKNLKCTSGVTFQYVKSLTDIYDTTVMTGDDDYSIYNAYNEFDIIDKFLVNLRNVDIAVDYNVDITARQTILDKIRLKIGHRVLLFGQTDNKQNGIYSIDKNFKLVLTDDISTKEKSDRFKVWVNLGTYFDKQIFLINEYDNYFSYNNLINYTFPISGSSFTEDVYPGYPVTYSNEKKFTTGHSYIIKNIFAYNTNSPDAKLIFTDIDIARKLQKSYDYFTSTNQITVTAPNGLKIKYMGYEDEIILSTTSFVEYFSYYTGQTYISATTQGTLFYVDNMGSHNFITTVNDLLNISINPNVRIQFFYGNSTADEDCFLDFTTTPLSNIVSNIFIPKDDIPGDIINFFNNTGGSYKLTNYSNVKADYITDFETALSYSPFYKYFSFSGISSVFGSFVFKLLPKYTDEYFDYSELYFNGINFNRNSIIYNKYVHYTLSDFMYSIDPIFDSSYKLWNDNWFQPPQSQLYYSEPNPYYSYNLANKNFIKIDGLSKDITMYFKSYTFVKLNHLTNSTIYDYVLVYEVGDDYIKIEEPYNYSFITGIAGGSVDIVSATTYTVTNVALLSEISIILNNLYTKTQDGILFRYNKKYNDDIVKKVNSAYANILCDDTINFELRNYATGILYADEKENFILKLCKLDDTNLTYRPIELIDIGVNKKTKYPIPITNALQRTSDTDWFSTGSTSGETYLYESKILNNEFAYSFGQFRGKFTYGLYSGESHGTNCDFMLLKTRVLNGQEMRFETGYADSGLTTNCLELDIVGNCFVGGSFYGDMYLSGVTISAGVGAVQTNYVLKYNRYSEFVDYIKIIDQGDSETIDIDIEYDAIDNKSYLYVVGWYASATTIGTNPVPWSGQTIGDFGATGLTVPIPIYPPGADPTGKVDFDYSFFLGYNLSAVTSGSSISYKEPRDNYIVKLDNDLNLIWATSIGSVGDDWISEVAIGKVGSRNDDFIYVTGQFNGSDCEFRNASVPNLHLYAGNNLNQVGNVYIAKLNKKTGQFIWAKKITTDSIECNYSSIPNFNMYGNRGTNITLDDTGLYTIGWYKYKSRYESNSDFEETTSQMNSDIYLLKTSVNGVENYHKTMKGNEIDDPLPGDQPTDIFLSGDNAYISGRFKNTIYLNTGGNLIGSGKRDSFVVKAEKGSGNVINKFAINCFDSDSEVHLEDIMIEGDYIYLSGHYIGKVLFDSTLKESSVWHFYFWKRKNNI